MQPLQLDLVIVQQIEHVQWLTGARYPLDDVAGCGLAGRWPSDARRPEEAGAGSGGRRGRHLRSPVAQHAAKRSAAGVERRAAEGAGEQGGLASGSASSFPASRRTWRRCPGERVDIEPTLYRLRRRKDADELARIRKAIAGTGKMYALARQIIEPGITEIEVFNRLQSAAVEEFGEMLTGTGNDYQCGARGGPPRNNRQAAGRRAVHSRSRPGLSRLLCRQLAGLRRQPQADRRAADRLDATS